MKRILIIDDDEIVRMSLEKELSSAGYSVFLAENGKDGVQKVQEQMSDLILLDIMMPEMNGVEVIDLLKKDKRTRNTPVIFITSLVKRDEIDDGFVKGSKGVDQFFVSKPFDMDEVLRLVYASIGEP
ncbi:MAG: response regulator [Candidatus Omnitrophica bacterium]|nr:response regulator [Candidatus Omnitrophota bacterium]